MRLNTLLFHLLVLLPFLSTLKLQSLTTVPQLEIEPVEMASSAGKSENIAKVLPGSDDEDEEDEENEEEESIEDAEATAGSVATQSLFKNQNECFISKPLYHNYFQGEKLDGEFRTCQMPGCFFIYDQPNLGWKVPGYLVDLHGAGNHHFISGCLYDIPYLLQRTYGKDRAHRAFRAARACFIGHLQTTNVSYFCQPEYADSKKADGANEKFGFDKGGSLSGREKWVGRFLPSIQHRCFLRIREGVFYVNDDGRELVVCCSGGNEEINDFKERCRETTKYIDERKWRADADK